MTSEDNTGDDEEQGSKTIKVAANTGSAKEKEEKAVDSAQPAAREKFPRISQFLRILCSNDNEDDSLSVKIIHEVEDWFVTIAVGFFVTSYWRGSWTLMDIWGCDQPQDASLIDGTTFCFMVPASLDESYMDLRVHSSYITYGVGLGLTGVGAAMMWLGWWHPRASKDGTVITRVPLRRAIVRFFILYVLGWAAVCQWRAIWYFWDRILTGLPQTDGSFTYGVPQPLVSLWTSTIVGCGGAYLMCAAASMLAPPGILLLDGPGMNPPPVAVTLVSTYISLTTPATEKPRKIPTWVEILDVIASFVILPWFVVGYWRGCWLLCDYYLWKFSSDARDLHNSMGYSTAIAAGCFLLTNETLVEMLSHPKSSIAAGTLSRLRTFILVFGVVNFWRVVWYIWDEFLPGPTTWSCVLSHFMGFGCLLVMGCMACIVAPASTLGVDVVPHPDCADEPLFCMLPITTPKLFAFGIGRKPRATLLHPPKRPEDEEYEMTYLEMQRPNLTLRVSTRELMKGVDHEGRPPLVRQHGMMHLEDPVLRRHESFIFRSR